MDENPSLEENSLQGGNPASLSFLFVFFFSFCFQTDACEDKGIKYVQSMSALHPFCRRTNNCNRDNSNQKHAWENNSRKKQKSYQLLRPLCTQKLSEVKRKSLIHWAD